MLTVLVLSAFAATPTLARQDPPAEPVAEATGSEPGAGEAAETGDQIDEIFAEEEALLAGAASTTYDPEGRRDPFRSLLERNVIDDQRPRPPGVPGLLIDEVDLEGIFLKDGVWVAMVRAGNKETSYLIRAGDELFDGDVLRINLDEVVFKQIVNDPKIFKPFREVVKKLNPGS
jgi:hypothetical protein